MKLLYKCEWCDFQGTKELVQQHEEKCQRSPLAREIERIRDRCPYFVVMYEDFYADYYCKKDGKNNWGQYNDCHCTLECKKYLKENNSGKSN